MRSFLLFAAVILCSLPAGAVDGLYITATRLVAGAISLSSSNHFPPIVGKLLAKPVAGPNAPPARCDLDPSSEDVVLALRTLGYRAGESRRAAALCADMVDACAEDRLRRALT